MGLPSHYYTIHYVAKLLGEDEDVIEEIVTNNMGPSEGTISIVDDDDHACSITAFSPDGIDNLKELLTDRVNW